MMHYLIYCEDLLPGSQEKRRSVRPAHLQHIQTLQATGHLLFAGSLLEDNHAYPPMVGIKGTAIIAEFADLEAAKAWAAADPYVTAGVYGSIVVHPLEVLLCQSKTVNKLLKRV